MSVETRTRVTETVRQDGTVLLSVATRIKLLQVYVVFLILCAWMTAPLALMLGTTPLQLIKLLGIFFGIIAALFILVSAMSRSRGSGTVLIDPNNTRLEKKGGFSAISWSEIDVPRSFILLQDNFTRESSMRRTTSTSVQAIQSQEKEVIYRLAVIPVEESSEAELQERWKAVLAHESEIKGKTYGIGKSAPLPHGATSVIEGHNSSLNQVIGDALRKAFNAALFDFTFAEPIMRGAGEQAEAFTKHLHAIEEGQKSGDGGDLKRPRRVRAKIRKNSMLLKTGAQPMGVALAAAIALPAVLCLISWIGMFFFTHETNIPVLITYVAYGFFLGGFMHRVVVDEKGLRIKLTSYGILPLGRSQYISWNEIGELRPQTSGGNSQLAIMSRSGEGKIGHLVIPDEKAGRWILKKIADYLRSRPAEVE